MGQQEEQQEMQTYTSKIGAVTLNGLCRLSPMAGISNIPFRLLCKELGSSLTTSEEISAAGLLHSSKKTFDIATYIGEEKPIAMQIFGADADILADAARMLQDRGADMIDLNMGCPVRKIIAQGAGSALMRDPEKCQHIFQTIRKAISIPFTIKIRGGWDHNHLNAPEIAHIAECEGIDAIAVHPRTRSQQYAGLAPWDIIRQVVDRVAIPVAGNGDIQSYSDAERMVAETGCVSVLIGRGALGRPWVFDPTFENLSPDEQDMRKYAIIEKHLGLIERHMKGRLALIQMKKHFSWYVTGRFGAGAFRDHMFRINDWQQVRDAFDNFWNGAS